MKTKEEEGNPVRWSLSLTGPGSAGVMRTVAPPLQLMAVVIYLSYIKASKQANKIMNRGRIDVACFRCYLKLETVPDPDRGPVPQRNIHCKVYSSQGASHRHVLLLPLSILGIS